MTIAVTFDFGQTLCDLDTEMLARRIGERGVEVSGDALEANVPAAWRVYDEAIKRGEGGHPWKILMRELLVRSGVRAIDAGPIVDWLWTEQPKKNLWRRPIPGMLEIVDELRDAGVPVGVLSNSEGRLAELVDEIGWSERFEVIVDSGRLGIEKPDRRIFEHAATALGEAVASLVHVGDSLAADVEGACNAGARAIWFRGRAERALPQGVIVARDAEGVRASLLAFALPISMR